MPEHDFLSLLSIAKESALLAGKLLSADIPANRRIHKEFAHDVKIEADIQSERIIIDYLMKRSDFSLLSEEKGMIQRDIKDYLWIVDPVDGSLNYTRQIPLCCVSIGLWKKETPVLGVIYDFNRTELFSGIAGRGAWLNQQEIKVSANKTKQKSILCTGFPGKLDLSTDNLNVFIEQIQSYRKIRLLGSAALSMAYVACGRTDAYYERDIMLWDIAGGIPIILGAGGHVHIEKTPTPHCFNVHVTNGHIKTNGKADNSYKVLTNRK